MIYLIYKSPTSEYLWKLVVQVSNPGTMEDTFVSQQSSHSQPLRSLFCSCPVHSWEVIAAVLSERVTSVWE